jgi:lipopolysaccharide export system protein LptA
MRNIPFLTGLVLLVAVPALGQALKGHNTGAPVDVEADRIEVQDRADRAVFSGNVVARQNDMTLNAGRLTVAYSRNGGGVDIERLDASGGVTVRSASETARGEFAIYDLSQRIITVVGNVQLTRGGNVVRGGRLVINLDTGRAVMDGRGVNDASGGRVSGRFTVTGQTK